MMMTYMKENPIHFANLLLFSSALIFGGLWLSERGNNRRLACDLKKRDGTVDGFWLFSHSGMMAGRALQRELEANPSAPLQRAKVVFDVLRVTSFNLGGAELEVQYGNDLCGLQDCGVGINIVKLGNESDKIGIDLHAGDMIVRWNELKFADLWDPAHHAELYNVNWGEYKHWSAPGSLEIFRNGRHIIFDLKPSLTEESK